MKHETWRPQHTVSRDAQNINRPQTYIAIKTVSHPLCGISTYDIEGY